MLRTITCAALLLVGCVAFPQRAPDALRPDAVAAVAPQTNAILVMREGEIALERYFRGATGDTLHNTRSATKTVTALLAGLAIADGKLSLDGPVWPLLEDVSGEPDALKRAITTADLLTMSSALDCDDSDPASPGQEEQMYPLAEWARWAAAIPSNPAYARDAAGRGPFHYCTGGVVLLGRAIARATGTPMEQYARERLFAPLGIADARWFHSPSGEPMPGGGLELSARDLAKLGWLLVDGGRWRGRQVVPQDFMIRMLSVQRRANADQEYGYLIWGRTYETPCGPAHGWYMAGNGGNAVIAFPQHRAVVVVARTAYNTRGMHQQTIELVERAILPDLICSGSG